MSRKISPVNEVLLTFWCPFCGAHPGQWCRTSRGTRASWLHELRFRKAVFAGALPLPDQLEPPAPRLRIVPHD